jgi:IS4 transposase
MRDMLENVIKNQLKFRYVLMDSWFGSVENFNFIVTKKKHFIVALKNNRLIALSAEDKKQGRYVRIDSLELSDQQAVRGWLKDYQHEVLIVRQVFTNKDGSTGLLNLGCSDLTCDGNQITSIYKKRWHVEVFHKSLKSNASLARSPTRRVTTQNNHVFMSIYAVYKLECLKIKHKLNHFALRMKLLITATQQSFSQLKVWQAA